MRTAGRARRGTRATTACRWRQRVVPRDAGHRGQRVLSRLNGRERGTFASRLVQFTITRVAVPRRANGPDPEPPSVSASTDLAAIGANFRYAAMGLRGTTPTVTPLITVSWLPCLPAHVGHVAPGLFKIRWFRAPL